MNKDNYRNAINQIHASDKLKEETLEKMKNNKHNKIAYIKYLSSVAAVILIFCMGFNFLNKRQIEQPQLPIATNPNTTKKVAAELPRFKNMEELKEVLEERNENYNRSTNSMGLLDSSANSEMVQEEANVKSDKVNDIASTKSKEKDFSTTNVQVENVDEADIIKTDGDYIYYVASSKIYIIEAKELKIIAEIKMQDEIQKSVYPYEIFINKDKLIVLAGLYEQEKEQAKTSGEIGVPYDYARVMSQNTAVAMIYDISNKEKPELLRQLGLDGNYVNSRMIGDNVYFISSKNVYYYNNMKDDEILPRITDTASSENTKIVDCTDIAYFKDTDNYSYMLVGGFNINNNDDMSVETFFGASSDIYASEKNLYITQTKYDDYYKSKTIIYKFYLDNSKISLTAKAEIEGYLNNQFSMDEYEGNLRVATTYYTNKNSMINVLKEVITDEYVEPEYSNRLYVLDENLNEIGRIDDLAKDEKIYSVRFMQKMGYIVTFEEIDPLFVIDLSDPTNPQIKGELKIPGYSAYLHPYDETHIIGIGYNTKNNKYGGIITDNMKMSMFDVSDLENPKEMFSIDIGKDYTYSDVLYNHKVLFYKKSDNLIGFPVGYGGNSKIAIYKIDLEKGFEEYVEISEKFSYMQRVIYIENVLYVLNNTSIISYDLKTFEKINELKLDDTQIRGINRLKAVY